MGIANKLVGILAPIILSTTILKGMGSFEQELKATTDAAQRKPIV